MSGDDQASHLDATLADVSPITLSDGELAAAIETQRDAVTRFEAEFVPMRRRYEALRTRLRTLEGEREQRRLAAEGQGAGFRPIPRRTITLADAVAGRARDLALDAPLGALTILSMRRQPIVLHPEGDRDRQSLPFHRPSSDGVEQAIATTLGEAQRLHAEGWEPGPPGVALHRLPIYYPETASAGWLRADQIYVERP